MMSRISLFGFLALVAFPTACSHPGASSRLADADPPVAKVEPFAVIYHRDSVTDDYHWLEDPDDPKVIAYLEAENAYTQAVMAPRQPLQEVLYRELSERVSKDELVLVRQEGDYFYYYRWEEGKGYPVYARKRGSIEAEEETLLDVNRLSLRVHSRSRRYRQVDFRASHSQS